jgi:hypothetical protein
MLRGLGLTLVVDGAVEALTVQQLCRSVGIFPCPELNSSLLSILSMSESPSSSSSWGYVEVYWEEYVGSTVLEGAIAELTSEAFAFIPSRPVARVPLVPNA